MQPVVHVQVTRKPANKAMSLLGVLVLVALFVSSCVGKYTYSMSAPPIARTIKLVEKDPTVTAALGAPVSVSFSVGTTISRELFGKLRGIDKAYVDTPLAGSKGQAQFDLVARNVNEQGWAGTFSVKLKGRSVLKDGGYVQEGARVLIEGDFAPDGSPRIKSP